MTPQPIHRIELCDAGMGETEYRIFEGDRFICQCPDNPTAWEVIHALQRPHTPAAPATEPLPIDGLQAFPFRLSDPKCCKDCWESEPLCHDTCGKYEMERDAAIREQVIQTFIDFGKSGKCVKTKEPVSCDSICEHDCIVCFAESLRGGAP